MNTTGLRGYCAGNIRQSFDAEHRRGLPAARSVTVADVLAAAVAVTALPTCQIIGQRRTRRVVAVRAAVYLVAIEETTLSICDIAKALNRDHSTLIKVTARTKAMIEARPEVAGMVSMIRVRAREIAAVSTTEEVEETLKAEADRRAKAKLAHRNLVELARAEARRLETLPARIKANADARVSEARRLRRDGWSVRALAKRYGWAPETAAAIIGEHVSAAMVECRA